MKMAAASEEDLEALNNLCIELEDCFPRWGFEASDEKIVEVVRKFWPAASTAFTRVIIGYGVLFDNAGEPNPHRNGVAA